MVERLQVFHSFEELTGRTLWALKSLFNEGIINPDQEICGDHSPLCREEIGGYLRALRQDGDFTNLFGLPFSTGYITSLSSMAERMEIIYRRRMNESHLSKVERGGKPPSSSLLTAYAAEASASAIAHGHYQKIMEFCLQYDEGCYQEGIVATLHPHLLEHECNELSLARMLDFILKLRTGQVIIIEDHLDIIPFLMHILTLDVFHRIPATAYYSSQLQSIDSITLPPPQSIPQRSVVSEILPSTKVRTLQELILELCRLKPAKPLETLTRYAAIGIHELFKKGDLTIVGIPVTIGNLPSYKYMQEVVQSNIGLPFNPSTVSQVALSPDCEKQGEQPRRIPSLKFLISLAYIIANEFASLQQFSDFRQKFDKLISIPHATQRYIGSEIENFFATPNNEIRLCRLVLIFYFQLLVATGRIPLTPSISQRQSTHIEEFVQSFLP